MHKLLVPFDGSENALRAVRYAIALAKQNGPVSIHVAPSLGATCFSRADPKSLPARMINETFVCCPSASCGNCACGRSAALPHSQAPSCSKLTPYLMLNSARANSLPR
jgi:Universal stress protein family